VTGPVVLGVDPGRTGGAVLLGSDGLSVLGAWKWRKSSERYIVRNALDGALINRVDCMGEVGAVLCCEATELQWPSSVVLEKLFVPRGGKVSPASFVTLAEDTGMLAWALRSLAPLERPSAGEWRAAVLGTPRNTSSDKAEAAAMFYCERALGMARPTSPHVAEAACMARWGWVRKRAAG